MPRVLFCNICPAAYKLSVAKGCLVRRTQDTLRREPFARVKAAPLPVVLYSHQSLIRRQLGGVDAQLQENKAVNLALAAPKISGVLISPGEVFSLWRLVGRCTKANGYLPGLTMAAGRPSSGVGGGLCQLSNLLHWLALHSPLTIAEHHHHDGFDLFPDCDRRVPFGCGTSIQYNYLDYRLRNNSDNTFQFILYTTDTHLCGELRAARAIPYAYRVYEDEMYFSREGADYFRRNKVYRQVTDNSGGELENKLIKAANARVMYDPALIPAELLRGE